MPPRLIEAFFRAAIEYAEEQPWSRLSPVSHFPLLLTFRLSTPSASDLSPTRRLAMIMGGEQSGGDALGLVLCEELPEAPGSAAEGLSSPALTVIYAGYPDPGVQPILWRGEPLPRSRAGLLAWPTIHDVDGRVRAPRRAELLMLTSGLLAVRCFVAGYPGRTLDDNDPKPHRCEIAVEGTGVLVAASPYSIPSHVDAEPS